MVTFITVAVDNPAAVYDPATVVEKFDDPDASVVGITRADGVFVTTQRSRESVLPDPDGLRSVLVEVTLANLNEAWVAAGLGAEPLAAAAHHAAFSDGEPGTDSTARVVAAADNTLLVAYRTR